MAKITVWSKQHENVWKVLQETGRYTVKREYIIKDLKEHSELVLDTYEWLVKNGPDYGNKPADVEFPVWVSFRQDATMLPEKGRVILELEIEESLITKTFCRTDRVHSCVATTDYCHILTECYRSVRIFAGGIHQIDTGEVFI